MLAMNPISRREFLRAAAAAALAASSAHVFAARHAHAAGASLPAAPKRKRIFIGSGSADGILAYHWDPATAELIPIGPAAKVTEVRWIAPSFMNEFLFVASSLNSFNGKPTGEVSSYRLLHGELQPVSAVNSAGIGTCHVALDRTGRVLIASDYAGGSAASYRVHQGELSEAVWQEHYTAHGPNKDRQEAAHAHFASFSPDNRYAYINDLGGDSIHIYKVNLNTAELTPAGTYHSTPGAGPRTLHFHANNHSAYSVNELDSMVDVLEWNRADGSLTLVKRIPLLPEGYTGPTRGCDVVFSLDGRFAYFANRDKDFLYSFRVDVKTGELTPMRRSNCGGKTPRYLVLDPTERWLLVANQDSNWISVFARNPETGELAEECKNYPAVTPMRILFT